MTDASVPNYSRLTLKEWRGIVSSTDNQYKKLLQEPNRRTIRKRIANPSPIDILQWTAVLVLLVLAIFTAFKTGALAIPFSNSLIDELSRKTPITEGVRTAFNYVTFVLFWLLSTPSLIYFKLLSHDERLVKQREQTTIRFNDVTGCLSFFSRLSGYFSLEYISPRLPAFITYMSTFWLLYISGAGAGTIFEKFLPVFAEIGLAQLVGDIIEQNTTYARIINDRYRMEYDNYERRLADKNDDERVGILSATMTEVMTNLVRNNQRPNAFMEKADKDVIKSVLQAEYQRLTVSDNFIRDLNGRIPSTNNEITQVTTLKPEITNLSAPITPLNKKKWDKSSLIRALKMLGAGKNYGEKDLNRDFAPGYGARTVWRSISKDFEAA